jgi:hypothetical protein
MLAVDCVVIFENVKYCCLDAVTNTGKTPEPEDERDVAEGREEEGEAGQYDAPTANESHSPPS